MNHPERDLPQYRAIIPEMTERKYKQLNNLNYQTILDLMKQQEVHAFEIMDSSVVRLPGSGRQERQTRRFVKLTSNSKGELCYVYPPNIVRLVSRDGKPLYLSDGVLEDIDRMRRDEDLRITVIEQGRGFARRNIWVAMMDGLGRMEESSLIGPVEDTLQITFLVTSTGTTKNATIDIYLGTILEEIDEAEGEAKSHIENIVCNGLVIKDNYILLGLRKKLEKLGFQVMVKDLPEEDIGYTTHKRFFVQKTI